MYSLKKERFMGSWFLKDTIHSQLDPREKVHDRMVWWRKAAHVMVVRKQIKKDLGREMHLSRSFLQRLPLLTKPNLLSTYLPTH